jgi:hypothetical protein
MSKKSKMEHESLRASVDTCGTGGFGVSFATLGFVFFGTTDGGLGVTVPLIKLACRSNIEAADGKLGRVLDIGASLSSIAWRATTLGAWLKLLARLRPLRDDTAITTRDEVLVGDVFGLDTGRPCPLSIACFLGGGACVSFAVPGDTASSFRLAGSCVICLDGSIRRVVHPKK